MINAQMLRLKGACAAQVRLFEELFPDGATLTVENALSVAPKFDWDWAAQNLLTPKNRDAYHAAVKLASDAYSAAVKPARDAYDAAIKPARDAYHAAVKSASDAYDVVKARTFAELYIKQEQTK